MTRVAVPADVDRVLAMARALWGEAPRLRDRPWSEERARGLVEAMVADGTLLIQGIGGFMGFVIHEDPMTGESMATEVALYVKPEFRGAGLALRMAQDAVVLARERGCAWFQSGAMTGTDEEAAAVVYARAGFEECARTYRCRLCPAEVEA